MTRGNRPQNAPNVDPTDRGPVRGRRPSSTIPGAPETGAPEFDPGGPARARHRSFFRQDGDADPPRAKSAFRAQRGLKVDKVRDTSIGAAP